MAYEPTNWKSGDIVTSAKLNKLEKGVQDAWPLIVHVDDNNTLDKTWQEIWDAGIFFVYTSIEGTDEGQHTCFTGDIYFGDSSYMVNVDSVLYTTEDPNGYPSNGKA